MRAALKKAVNLASGSRLIEEKSHNATHGGAVASNATLHAVFYGHLGMGGATGSHSI